MEAIVESALKCVQCRSILDCPVLLPCSDSICKKHVPQEASDFHCLQCDLNHVVPAGGFPHNKSLQILLAANVQTANVSPLHQSALASFNKLTRIIDEAHLLHSDPFYLVNQKIGELKNETDIMRDEFKLRIDQTADAILGQLNGYEQKCKRNLNSNEIVQRLAKISAEMGAIKAEMNHWQVTFNCFDSSEEEWKRIQARSDEYANQMEWQLNESVDELLLGKLRDYQIQVAAFTKLQLKSNRM
jgi:hypothetical protein